MRYRPCFALYGYSGVPGTLVKTLQIMYEYKPRKGMTVRTAMNQLLPILGIGKLHLTIMYEPPPVSSWIRS